MGAVTALQNGSCHPNSCKTNECVSCIQVTPRHQKEHVQIELAVSPSTPSRAVLHDSNFINSHPSAESTHEGDDDTDPLPKDADDGEESDQPPNRVGSTYVGMLSEASIVSEADAAGGRMGSKTSAFTNPDLKGYTLLPDGSRYLGEWVRKSRHGKGKCMYSEAEMYEGEWFNDVPHGSGAFSTLDAKYVGFFQEGARHGNGQLRFSDGSTYQGEFKSNNVEGAGTFLFSDGRKYKGQWRDNKMHGSGVHEWPDGTFYKGQYANDFKEGDGMMTWTDGRRYNGQWNNGKQDGRGSFCNKSGKDRVGEWRDGSRVRWLDSKS